MKKVLLIGDSCLDVFIYGFSDRLCPEAPVPILNKTKTIFNNGMCGNVYENLYKLNIKCDIITNNNKPIKTRFVDEVSNQMILRVDENDIIAQISDDDLNKINFNDYCCVIISDYNKGFLNENNIKNISTKHNLVFMDTKKKIGDWANGIEFIKINEKEYQNNIDYFLKEYKGELIVTLGKNGAMHWTNKYPIEEEHVIRDLSGAGDTFLAALVSDYIKNFNIPNAIKFANKCASWVVTQKGVIPIDINKI